MRGGNLVAAAFALTALSYGLARFAYGLLLPQIRADLSLGAAAAGWIGGGAFAAYCGGIALASLRGARLGARRTAMLAGLTATLGTGLVAIAPSAPALGFAIALAGLSTGLASPPLAAAVARRFDAAARPRANGMINAGTAAGIVFSGAMALAFAAAWRELYALFALIGAGVTAWLWFAIPGGAPERAAPPLRPRRIMRPGLGALCAAAILMGASSTAVWTFGADMLRGRLGLPAAQIPLVWIALGLGGLCGAGTGLLIARLGTGATHRAALLGLALSQGLLLATAAAQTWAFAAMGLFGAAYIVSSGVLLIRGTALLPDRPDLGLGIPFLAIAIGQTAGAPFLGTVLNALGPGAALAASIALACGAMPWRMEGSGTASRRAGGPGCQSRFGHGRQRRG